MSVDVQVNLPGNYFGGQNFLTDPNAGSIHYQKTVNDVRYLIQKTDIQRVMQTNIEY